MKLAVAERDLEARQLHWSSLSGELRQAWTGKLRGLWGATGDEEAFDSLSIDKQQALLLIFDRLRAKRLWDVVRRIENVYGEGGVGMEFTAWPLIESTLARRKDFTRLFAHHRNTAGGFHEKGRAEAALHFLFEEKSLRKWYVHFDLYSPIDSPSSAFRHLRHEFLGKVKPDWRMIYRRLQRGAQN